MRLNVLIMKKLFIILTTLVLLITAESCKTTKPAVKSKPKAEITHRDDFKAAPDAERQALLKKLNATGDGYSVVIFTKNFKGEEVVVKNAQKTFYKGYPISNMKSGVAETIRIDNSTDIKVLDSFTKKEATLTTKETKKHKFIYVMQNPGKTNPFTVTYSNTLRPLE